MSYARWGWDNSDVYVFTAKHIDNKYVVECCGCIVEKLDAPITDFFGIERDINLLSFYAKTRGEIDAHLKEHVSKGDIVPERTFNRLELDYPNPKKLIDDYEKERDY